MSNYAFCWGVSNVNSDVGESSKLSVERKRNTCPLQQVTTYRGSAQSHPCHECCKQGFVTGVRPLQLLVIRVATDLQSFFLQLAVVLAPGKKRRKGVSSRNAIVYRSNKSCFMDLGALNKLKTETMFSLILLLNQSICRGLWLGRSRSKEGVTPDVII